MGIPIKIPIREIFLLIWNLKYIYIDYEIIDREILWSKKAKSLVKWLCAILGKINPRTKKAVKNCFENCIRSDATKIYSEIEKENKDPVKLREGFQKRCLERCDHYLNENYIEDVRKKARKYLVTVTKRYYKLFEDKLDSMSLQETAQENSRKLDTLIDQNTRQASPSETPHELTHSFLKPNCLYRETELNGIRTLLSQKKNLVLVNGLGGIGKTTLAKQIYLEIGAEYDHIGWVSYQGSLENSIPLNFLWPETENRQEMIAEIYKLLQKPTLSKLLVIDNVTQEGEPDEFLQELTSMPNLTVILTSRRSDLDGYEPFPVNELKEDACINLFIEYYTKEKRSYRDSQREMVRTLVRLGCYNTLMVELLAKSAKNEKSLEAFYDKLITGFEYETQASVSIPQRGNQTMANHLRKLFQLTERTEEEVRILQNFSLMPSMAIPSDVTDWIDCSTNDLNTLCASGWLSFGEQEETGEPVYSMHPLVKETILLDRTQFPESIGEEFVDCLADERYITSGEPYTTALPKLDIADSVLNEMRGRKTKAYASACDRLANLYRNYGSYDKSKEYFEQSLIITEEIQETEDPNTAAAYNNLALSYQHKGLFDEAEKYYQIALEILKKTPETNPEDIATIYNNLAMLYQAQRRFGDAEAYLLEACDIRETVLGPDHKKTATTYNNLALLYQAQGRFDEAEEYYQKARAIRETVLGTEHPDTASTYHNLGTLFFDQEQFEEAMKWFLTALPIRLSKLRLKHSDTEDELTWIKSTYPHLPQSAHQPFEDWFAAWKAEHNLP